MNGGFLMPCKKANEMAALVLLLATLIADNIEEDAELDVIASSFTQLGDTLFTILSQRAFLEAKGDSNGSKQQIVVLENLQPPPVSQMPGSK